MKAIFLDFDGVLNSAPYLSAQSKAGQDTIGEAAALDPVAIERLNRIIEATGALVVISSSWRYGRPRATLSLYLHWRGFAGFVIGVTPQLETAPSDGGHVYVARERGDEIKAWLDDNAERLGVESYIVLDDNSDMTAVRDRFIQTSFAEGLTDAHVERAIEMLNEAA